MGSKTEKSIVSIDIPKTFEFIFGGVLEGCQVRDGSVDPYWYN